MKDIIKIALILSCFGIAAAASLGAIHKVTAPAIARQMERTRQEALEFVLPDAKIIDEVNVEGDDSYFAGYSSEDKTGKPDFYAFIAKGQGYSSVVQTMVGIDNSGNILGLRILFQQETPGLGAKADSEDFLSRFSGGKSAFGIAVDKDGGEITSITGATITSRTITKSISEKVDWLNKIVNIKQ